MQACSSSNAQHASMKPDRLLHAITGLGTTWSTVYVVVEQVRPIA